MGKKFIGLGGLKHFWTKAKTWIAGQITAEVTAKIAELVANAPEDLDTLKEIADWISTHANDASAMNTQINTNKNDIAALQTSVAGKAAVSHTHDDRYYTESEVDTKLGKKSDTGHTHSASDITSGVLPVAKGGTGVATQAAINRAFIGNLDKGESDVTDGTEFVSSYASNNGFDENAEFINTPYRRKFSAVWGYIKGKISSVLGLTKDNYGGTAATILDYNRNTPIKVRWGGPGINSAEWYPAFNADGSALEPINRTNIHAGTADSATTAGTAGTAGKVASAGASGMWIQGRANAICKTTSAGENGGWKTLASIKTRYGSIEIGNLANEDYVRIVYSSDANVSAGNNNVSDIMRLFGDAVSFTQKIYANAGIRIPTSQPSSLEDGDIWIQ